jgi:hypothetical protein
MSETAFLRRNTTVNERYLLSVDDVCASVVELASLRLFVSIIAIRYIFSPEAALRNISAIQTIATILLEGLDV